MASRFVDGASCGTQARVVGQSCVKAAAAGVAKSVNVELPGVVQSTWKW
jgi:hypothetical protein